MSIDYSRTFTVLQSLPILPHAQDEAWKLYEGWARKYYATDCTFNILAVEQEYIYWLDSQTCLVGAIDLLAETSEGERFFGDWKTLNPRRKKVWRQGWEMKCQALTYAVLSNKGLRYARSGGANGEKYLKFQVGSGWSPDAASEKENLCHRYLVRVAMKSQVPDYDHEWFRFNDADVNFWEGQVMQIADEIRGRRERLNVPWQPNFDNCFKYGAEYVCPWYEVGCKKLRWNMQGLGSQRESHLMIEPATRALPHVTGKTVILDATRLGEYINCHEKYRKQYEDGGQGWQVESNEALQIGTGLHGCLRDYYEQIRQSQRQSQI